MAISANAFNAGESTNRGLTQAKTSVFDTEDKDASDCATGQSGRRVRNAIRVVGKAHLASVMWTCETFHHVAVRAFTVNCAATAETTR